MARALFRGSSEHHYLDDWVDLEDRCGVRSTLYFSVPVAYRHEYDSLYSLDEPIHFGDRRCPLHKAMREMVGQGWEIGLHSTYGSYDSARRLRAERSEIESVVPSEVIGVRQHWLHFDPGRTWPAQEAAGLLYDTTLGFNETPGHRAGIAFPFHPYDFRDRRTLDLWELPLTIMDGAMFSHGALKLDEELALEHCCRIIDEVANTGGLCVLNWHLQARDEVRFPGRWRTYSALLSYAQEHGAWLAPARQVCEHWESRVQKMKLCGGSQEGAF